MADAAGARLFVPVHHRSFSLSREPVDEPIARAEQMLHAERGRLGLREIGETLVVVELSRAQRFLPMRLAMSFTTRSHTSRARA